MWTPLVFRNDSTSYDISYEVCVYLLLIPVNTSIENRLHKSARVLTVERGVQLGLPLYPGQRGTDEVSP